MIKKGDVILSVACVLAAVLFFVGTLIFRSDGKTVVVTVDGEIFGEYSLSQDQTVEVKTEKGHNTIVLKGGKVTVKYADCTDGYCVSHVAVDSTGETIVCLPHRMIIEIKE